MTGTGGTVCNSLSTEYNYLTSIPGENNMKKFLLSVCVLISVLTPTFAIDMSREIDAAAAKVLPKVIEWRRYIHQHPELSNRETNTAKFVEDHLRKLGLEVRAGVAKTGVIGILKGAQPG